MVLIVKLIAIALVIYGIVLVLRPEVLKKALGFVKEGNNYYVAGVIKAGLGLILVLAGGACSIPGVIRVLGALMFIGGVVTFVLKKETVMKLIEYWDKKPVNHIKMAGIFTVFIGVLIAAAA